METFEMKKLIATVLVTTLATLSAAGSASALPNKDVLDALLNSLKKKSTESTSPGDAFYPATPDSDRRAACEEAGGSVEGTRREWVCVF
jgi:hypothetical protein